MSAGPEGAHGEISFAPVFHSTELTQVDVPVEVRKPNLAVVSRSRVSGRVELPAGRYFVTARLPAGQMLHGEVEVQPGTHQEVRLEIDPAERSPQEDLELLAFAFDGRIAVPHPANVGPVGAVRLTIFDGNLLVGGPTQVEGEELELDDDAEPSPAAGRRIDLIRRAQQQWVVHVAPADRQMLLVEPIRGAATTLLLPTSTGFGCWVVLSADREGIITARAVPEHPPTALAMGYFARGQHREVLTSVESLLPGSLSLDPLLGAIVGQALLARGDLDRAEPWMERHHSSFPDSPDVVATTAECFARAGRHDRALEILRSLVDVGLPVLRSVVMVALDRLQFYRGLSGPPTEDTDEASESLLSRMQRFEAAMDRWAPISMWKGLPGAPLRPEAFSSSAAGVRVASRVTAAERKASSAGSE